MSILYKNDIKRILPLLQEMEEGKTLQIKTRNGWIDVDADKDGVNIDYLLNDRITVRIKQEPKYRPFKDAEECFEEMKKHQPFGWIKNKHHQYFNIITICTNFAATFQYDEVDYYDYRKLINEYTFADGSTFGIVENEPVEL